MRLLSCWSVSVQSREPAALRAEGVEVRHPGSEAGPDVVPGAVLEREHDDRSVPRRRCGRRAAGVGVRGERRAAVVVVVARVPSARSAARTLDDDPDEQAAARSATTGDRRERPGPRHRRVQRGDERLGFGDGDRDRGVARAAEPTRHLLVEVHADSPVGVGAEREAVVGHRQAGAGGRPPAVPAGDVGAVDVRERGLDPQPSERRDEPPVVGEGDAVLRPRTPNGPQNGDEAEVGGVGKGVGHAPETRSRRPAGSRHT